ncbi:MAG: ferritin-like domain-containing protein [Polyangiaceae bacterium]
MKKTLMRVLGMVIVGGLPVTALLTNACSTIPADPDEDAGVCERRQVAFDAGDDAPSNCNHFFAQPCGIPDGVQGVLPAVNSGVCQFNTNDCTLLCGAPNYLTCLAVGPACEPDGNVLDLTRDSAAGPLIVECGSCVGIAGRRPGGLDEFVGAHSPNAVGAYFATCAYLEAASVHAFRILRRELVALGAPADLLEAATRAEADEVKHTCMTRKLARAHGGTPQRVRVKKNPNRSLEEIALENAVEGCVRETFGALLAMWQAEHATDAAIADAMKVIAVDETRHAAFSWAVAGWADEHLDEAARARVAAARDRAFAELEKEIAAEIHPDLIDRAGMPSARDQKRLLAEMKNGLSASWRGSLSAPSRGSVSFVRPKARRALSESPRTRVH